MARVARSAEVWVSGPACTMRCTCTPGAASTTTLSRDLVSALAARTSNSGAVSSVFTTDDESCSGPPSITNERTRPASSMACSGKLLTLFQPHIHVPALCATLPMSCTGSTVADGCV